MATEYIEWLERSSPIDSAQPPVAVKPATCSQCGRPLTAESGECPHCQAGTTGTTGEEEADLRLLDSYLADLDLAVPQPTIQVEAGPEVWFNGATPDAQALYTLRLQAEHLRVPAGFDRLICLDDISVTHYEHQLETALHVLRSLRGRALLADEVGLGKTIEAGIIMKELLERGLARKILIITPAPLTWQWHEEMQSKFHEDFTVLEKRQQLPPPGRQVDSCHWIISLDRAKTKRWAARLLADEYDLLIVDEAHKLKNHRTMAYRFVNAIRKNYVLMLTATPVHNDLMELYNLVTILKPGHLGTRAAFRREYVRQPIKQNASRRQPHRRTIYSRSEVPPYLRRNRQARQAYRSRPEADQGTLRIVRHTENRAEFVKSYWKHGDQPARRALDEIEALLATGYEIVEFEGIEWRDWFRRHNDFVCRLKRRPQPTPPPQPDRDAKRDVDNFPRNVDTLRRLLREVMVRNRRSQVAIRFPPREAAIYHLTLTPAEQDLYLGVSHYIRRRLQPRAQPATDSSTRRSQGARRLTMMTLQKELCSTPQAVTKTLTKLAQRQPDESLTTLLTLAHQINRGRKVTAILEILAQFPGKFLIFTGYSASMQALQAALSEAGHDVVRFHGGLSAQDRLEVVRAFRQSARVLISTHSGGEGHNLQFCHQMINLDLPWNPMQIEQRIGRIHRLGQQNEVLILNLTATETIEAYVLDLLARKIRMFELVIGELDLILGELGQQRSLESLINEAWSGSQSEAELHQKIVDLEGIIDDAFVNYQKIKATSDRLSDLIDGRQEG